MFPRWRTLAAAAGAICFPFALAYGSTPQNRSHHLLPAICSNYHDPKGNETHCPYLREYWHERYYRDSWDAAHEIDNHEIDDSPAILPEPGSEFSANLPEIVAPNADVQAEVLTDSIDQPINSVLPTEVGHDDPLLTVEIHSADVEQVGTEPTDTDLHDGIFEASTMDESVTLGEPEYAAEAELDVPIPPAEIDTNAVPPEPAATLGNILSPDCFESYQTYRAEQEYDLPDDDSTFGSNSVSTVHISNIEEIDAQVSRGQEELALLNAECDGLAAHASTELQPAAQLVGIIEELCDDFADDDGSMDIDDAAVDPFNTDIEERETADLLDMIEIEFDQTDLTEVAEDQEATIEVAEITETTEAADTIEVIDSDPVVEDIATLDATLEITNDATVDAELEMDDAVETFADPEAGVFIEFGGAIESDATDFEPANAEVIGDEAFEVETFESESPTQPDATDAEVIDCGLDRLEHGPKFHMFYPGCDWSHYLPSDVVQVQSDLVADGATHAMNFPFRGAFWLSHAAVSLVTWTGKLSEQVSVLMGPNSVVETSIPAGSLASD